MDKGNKQGKKEKKIVLKMDKLKGNQQRKISRQTHREVEEKEKREIKRKCQKRRILNEKKEV